MVAGYPCRSSNTRTWHICQQGAPFGQNVRYHCHINIGWMRFWEGIVISRGMTDLNSHEIHQSSCFRYSVINYLISSFSLADHTSLRFGSSIRLTHRGVTDILLMSDPFWAKELNLAPMNDTIGIVTSPSPLPSNLSSQWNAVKSAVASSWHASTCSISFISRYLLGPLLCQQSLLFVLNRALKQAGSRHGANVPLTLLI